jgi:hypothetical protein
MRPLPFKKLVSAKYPRGFLIGAYGNAEDFLDAHDPKKLLMVTSKAPPSEPQVNLYWAILGVIVKHHGFYYDAKVLNDVVKYGLNYVDTWVDHEMNLHTELRPNSKIERGHGEFNEFFQRAMDFLFAHIMPGMRKEVYAEVERWLGTTVASTLPRGKK